MFLLFPAAFISLFTRDPEVLRIGVPYLRVLSLCKLGQTQAAKQVGARLLKKAKGSPWYQSVAESCAAD